MATKTAPAAPQLDTAAFEEAADRVRELNERIIAGSKTAGLTAIDAYEKALTTLVDFEQKVAGASQLEWVTALANTHAQFVQDVTAVYTKTVRDLLA